VAISCSLATNKPLVARAGPPGALSATFTVSNTRTSDVAPSDISVDWGSGSSVTAVVPGAAVVALGGTRTYNAAYNAPHSTPGTKAVTVYVQDASGQADTDCGIVNVRGAGGGRCLQEASCLVYGPASFIPPP
jgi:hypothetical protein